MTSRPGRILALLLPLLVGSAALAVPVTNVSFIASDSAGRAAVATFEIVGSDLVISFTNSATGDVLAPSQVLCAMFFDVSGPLLNLDQTASGASVVLGPGSTVLFPNPNATDGPPFPAGNVGGEWAYAEGLSTPPSKPRGAYGVSAEGYGTFNSHDLFPGTNLDGGATPDGIGYCLTSAGDNPATGHSQVTGARPLIKNGVVITLPGLPPGFDLAQISNVGFQYGNTLNDVYLIGIPEPGTLLLVAAGAMFTVGRIRSRRAAR